MQTKIKKWGNSQGIRIPQSMLKELDISTSDELNIAVEDQQIIIKKVNKKVTIEDLFKDYNGDYKPQEFNWGEAVGREVW